MINQFRFFFAMALWLGSMTIWAIDVRTSINAIAHEGNYQTLGIFTIVVDRNEFPNASPGNPVYIRFRLVHSTGWSHSLVDLRSGADASVNQPINLAIVPPASGVSLNPSLPAETIQIVRLIKGEREGWLRISQASSTWVQGPAPPSPEDNVSVTIGISGLDSIQSGTNTYSGGNEYAISRFPTGTGLRANYRGTPFFNNGDLEFLDFIGFDSTTQGVETGDLVFPGAILAFGFSNDLAVARGTFNFPCLDYHFDPDNFEANFHTVPISRINLIDFRKFQFDIPPVYLSNTSDFPWQQGTNLFLNLPGFNTNNVLAGISIQASFDEALYPLRLAEGPVKAVATDEGKWEITTLYWGDEIAGYRFVLTEGFFGINQRLEITGMRGSSPEDYYGRSLILAAKAYYRHEQITFGELKSLGPITRKTVELVEADSFLSRKVIPYTAYDQDDWQFNLHLLNTSEQPLAYTALFYNRHGILLRILGNQNLGPNRKRMLNIEDLFGQQAAGILSWVEILSEQPFQALSEIRNDDIGLLDIFPANENLQQTLYGLHLPTQIQTWQTTAYVLSADLTVDTEFKLMFPETDPFQINNIFLPGGTAILSDNYFVNQQGRQPWFQIETSTNGGAGILLYSRRDQSPQLVSILMNLVPTKAWRYDHLGNPNGGWWNGLVLFNPSDSEIRITIRGLTELSQPIGETQITLPPQSKYITLANQVLSPPGNAPFAMLQATSNQPFLSFLLLGKEDQSILTRVSGNLPESTQFRLAYLPRNTDEWAGLALFNPQIVDQEAQLTLIDADGQPGPSATLLLPANGKKIFGLKDILGDITAFGHLMIESQNPIRAFGITGNDAGTQLATVDPQAITL